MADYWGSCLELCMPRGFVDGHSLANRGLHRRCITSSLSQVNSRQGQGLLYAPVCWTQQEKGKWKRPLDVQKAGTRWRGPRASLSCRQKGDKAQHLQMPWSQDQEGRRGPGCKGATTPPLGHAFKYPFQWPVPKLLRLQCSPESPGDLLRRFGVGPS